MGFLKQDAPVVDHKTRSQDADGGVDVRHLMGVDGRLHRLDQRRVRLGRRRLWLDGVFHQRDR